MANFSVNQVRQLYVVNKCKTSNEGVQSDFAETGDLQVKKAENDLYFLYNGPAGVLKSDFIPIKNITSAIAIDAAKNVTTLRKVDITLNSNINSGAPVSGADYTLGINFKGFFSPGDDSQYYKDVVVHITSAIATASDFYKAMVKALNKAFAREDGATATSNPYLKFGIYVSGTGVLEETSASFASAAATKLVIEEKEQEWILGTMPQRRVMFDLFPGTIWTGGDDVIWAAQDATTGQYYSEASSPTVVGNGKKIADLEWFCCGERGDQYRGMGYPNTIHTEYLVDPSKEYHLIEIHYAFTDTGVNSYRTEKEITLAVPKGASTANYTEVNKVIAAINYFAPNTLTALS